MPSRHNSKGNTNPYTRTHQGECDPVPEQQQQSETDMSSGTPPTPRGIADQPHRHWVVIEPDPSYITRPGPGQDHIIRPWQVNAVVGAPADQVDEVIAQVGDLEEPPSEGDFKVCSRQPASGSGHHYETVSHTTVPSDTRTASSRSKSKGYHGKSLVDRESGISLDGFPSRSMEEGGVSGLWKRNSGNASDGTTSAAATCPSSSSGCVSGGSSAMAMNGAIIHTARAVAIHHMRAAYPYDGVIAVHRPPLPAELDRMDERLEDALKFMADFSPGTVARTQASDDNEDLRLTSDRKSIITLPNRDQVSEGRLGPPSSPQPHYTQGRPPLAGNIDGHPTGVEHAQPRPVSPTPSESNITETVFDVRRPTPPPPPPPQPDTISLPSSRRHANAAAGPSGGGRRGGAYPSSGVGQEEAVPAVLAPRGWLGLGGSHPPPHVSRRQGRDDPDGKEELSRRKAREQ
ncbi:hypothetical protein INS49_007948 [Diaporthe citri]|uniref:uncharacterized protein n=1 Tax=Diaporthe citri TaxID=83186 RepID=UPI001C7FB980|nr:uncharacterized protein INS49_007948 [Diaporthe citri]KAG6362853.1 hypothetical protein INS49_007948 [Diaporthe citri]